MDSWIWFALHSICVVYKSDSFILYSMMPLCLAGEWWLRIVCLLLPFSVNMKAHADEREEEKELYQQREEKRKKTYISCMERELLYAAARRRPTKHQQRIH